MTISTCGVRALSNAAPALSILSAQHRIGHTCTCAPAGGASYLQAPDLKQQVRACAPLQSCAHPLRRAPLPVRLSTSPTDGARRTSKSPRPLTTKAPRVPPAPPPPPPLLPALPPAACNAQAPFPSHAGVSPPSPLPCTRTVLSDHQARARLNCAPRARRAPVDARRAAGHPCETKKKRKPLLCRRGWRMCDTLHKCVTQYGKCVTQFENVSRRRATECVKRYHRSVKICDR